MTISFRKPGETPPPATDQLPVMRLGPLRHKCHSCGTCCTGWSVQMVHLDERTRLIAQAQELGVEEPLVDGNIRRVEGRCVFLSPDNLCAIHARFGASAKPVICQHYPKRSRQTEDGVRIAVDPGCSSNWRTFADGPEIPPFHPRTVRAFTLAPNLLNSERALISLARYGDMTVPLYIAALIDDQSALPAPHPAFVKRLLSRIALGAPLLADRQYGDKILAALDGVVQFLLRFDETGVPEWRPLAPESDAFALDLLQRHLFLRIGDDAVPPIVHTMIVLAGALACAYVDRDPKVFGESMAAWSRVCRTNRFWLPSMPSLAAGQWVLKGIGDPDGAAEPFATSEASDADAAPPDEHSQD